MASSVLEPAPTDNIEPAISLVEIQDAPVVSARSTSSNSKPIIIVIASFTTIFTCCGINFAFGVYQSLYQNLSTQPDNPFTGATPAQIDLIGTTAVALMALGGPFAVAWAKLFSPRQVSLAGSAIFTLALILASFGTKLWHFELTQGLLLGIGTCLAYMTAVTVAPGWFTARRGLAMGIILAGTGVGGLVWAPATRACIDQMGYRNTLRLVGGVSFVLNTAASMAMTWEPSRQAEIEIERNASSLSASSGQRGRMIRNLFMVPLVDLRLMKTRRFVAQALGAVFQAGSYYIPIFFFATYASTLGYSDTAGANFIALSNACNAVGKIVIGYAADRYGRLNVFVLTNVIGAVAALVLWVPSTLLSAEDEGAAQRGLFIAFTIFYGIFVSASVALFPTSLVELFGPQNFASVNGFLYMLRGVATMIATPIGGVLIRGDGVSMTAGGPRMYEGMSIMVTMLLFAATFSVVWIRIEAMVAPDGRSLNWKWKL